MIHFGRVKSLSGHSSRTIQQNEWEVFDEFLEELPINEKQVSI